MPHFEKQAVPTQIVLLGGTGDLARKKLLSALLDLYATGALPERLHLVAFSKDDLSDETYRSFVREHAQRPDRPHEPAIIEAFLSTIEYVRGMFDDRDAFERIRSALTRYDTSIGMCTSKLFYLAVPPVFYDTIFEQIAHTRLDLPCAEGDGWVRILVEKPFGSDLAHAHMLEDKLSVLFREEQVYRIDHYLAKDALQNILAFRFSNSLFEDQWNNTYVEGVYLRVFERFDVSQRGAFFDGVGALRDVGQNHMLQMLALIAMDRPHTLDTASLRAARARVLRSIRPARTNDVGTHIVKGQYDGYRTTAGVAPHSNTETYFALKTYLDTERWEGVPWYLEHGKAMGESVSDITVRFRSAKLCVCGERAPHEHPNFLRFSISPEQKISIRFWVRAAGTQYALEPSDLTFDRAEALRNTGTTLSDAYEEVLSQAICGDQTLFVSSDEQQAAWAYVTGILEQWNNVEPDRYASSGSGPTSDLKNEISRMFNVWPRTDKAQGPMIK